MRDILFKRLNPYMHFFTHRIIFEKPLALKHDFSRIFSTTVCSLYYSKKLSDHNCRVYSKEKYISCIGYTSFRTWIWFPLNGAFQIWAQEWQLAFKSRLYKLINISEFRSGPHGTFLHVITTPYILTESFNYGREPSRLYV